MKTLLILGAALAPFALAIAADETTQPQTLTPVVVTGTRSSEAENRLPASITVITREQIERSGASSVVDVIRGSGTAQVTDYFGNSSSTSIVDLRGLGDTAGSNTLILVDGRRLNNPDIAPADLNSIALKDVERIEIVQGSASVLYGDQAVGGVINIITRSIQKTTASIEATAGSYSNFGTRAQGGQRLGDFAYRLSAEERGSHNYRNHNSNEYRNFLGYTEYNYGKDSRVFGEASYADEDFELAGALTPAQVDQNREQVQPGRANDFVDTRTRNFRVGVDQNLFANWSLLAEGTHRQSHADVFLGGSFTQDREINALTPRVIGKFAMPNGQAQLTFGADLQKARYKLAFGVPTTNTQGQRDFYTQLILPLPAQLEATVGGRIGRVDNDAVFNNFAVFPAVVTAAKFSDTQNAGELGLAWRPVKPARVYVRYEKNFRFAKVDEFTNLAFGAANCDTNQPICTQTGRSYEIGGEWTEKNWNAAVSVYRLDLNKEIVYDPTTFANTNLDGTRRDGETLRLGWQALSMLRLGATYQHIDAQVRSGKFTGNAVPMVASQIGTLSADVDLPLLLVLHTEVLATSNRTFSGDFSNKISKLGGYTTTNLALSRNSGPWQFTARINNLFNTEYSEYGAFVAANPFAAPPTPDRPSFYPSPKLNGMLTIRYVY